MRVFLDSASLEEIEESLKRGFLGGVTTNPSILSKETAQPNQQIRKIIDLLHRYEVAIPLSIELLSINPENMKAQVEQFLHEFSDYDNLYIKVPIGWHNLEIMRFIHDLGGYVNCTCCMSVNQCVMGAMAGAAYVSIFWGRINDTGYDAARVVRESKTLLKETSTEIIVGSIRQMIDITNALAAGADIVTVPYKFLAQMCAHPKTDEVVKQFMFDYQNTR